MVISGNAWQVYPDDAPGFVGRDIPGARVFIHRIYWRPDSTSVAGDASHVKDNEGRTIFFHEGVSGETEYVREYTGSFPGPLEVPALVSGVLEIIVE